MELGERDGEADARQHAVHDRGGDGERRPGHFSGVATVVLKRSMNIGIRVSSIRHTVWTLNPIFRLSRLSTVSSPMKSSV